MRRARVIILALQGVTLQLLMQLLVFTICLFLFLNLFSSVQAQSAGWISIDCGSTADAVDPITGITWVTDSAYISTGENVEVPAARTDYIGWLEFETLRRFNNSRAKNCYTLKPLLPNSTYLIRASFFYDSYDGATQSPSFKLAIDTDVISDLLFINPKIPRYVEVTMNAVTDRIYLCLVQDESMSIPFVSAIMVRPLAPIQVSLWFNSPNNSELSQGYKFRTRKRLNFGGGPFTTLRYPDDELDRYWIPVDPNSPEVSQTRTQVTNISNQAILWKDQSWHSVPGLVFSTALSPASARPSNFTVSFPNDSNIYNPAWLNLYFAELDLTANASGARHFGIQISDPQVSTVVVNLDNVTENGTTVCQIRHFVYTPDFRIDFFPITPTRLGPLLNGLEAFEILNLTVAATSNEEVLAMETIKWHLDLSDWAGDPCLPRPYEWLTCSNISSTSDPHILEMNLSSYGLVGEMPSEISQLTKLTSLALDHNAFAGPIPNYINGLTSLQTLDLQSNGLSGPIPEWLASMTSLTNLFLQNNNFSGRIPAALLNKTGPFNFMYGGNPFLITSTNATQTSILKTTVSNNSTTRIIIGVVLGALLIIVTICVVGVYFVAHPRKKSCGNHRGASNMGGTTNRPDGGEETQANQGNPEVVAKSYPLAEVVATTKNFNTRIGSGSGLRPVYFGKLANGKEVAVKVFTKDPRQHGLSRFSTEVDVLSRVFHKHVVVLVGYCQDKQIVIYEYMPKGSLHDVLYGGDLNWRTRLNIAFEASQGLDYLHNSCHPPIIHRNIKNTTILLDNNMVAKLSSFGLSREMPLDSSTHVSTNVLGTPGYLDPEYARTRHLTTKSDVYSFGVVCLELLTGRAAFDSTQPNPIDRNICDWVRHNLHEGSIETIVSPAIKASNPNSDALWKFADTAMECVQPTGEQRPTMAHVVQELRIAIDVEEGPPSQTQHPRDSSDIDSSKQ